MGIIRHELVFVQHPTISCIYAFGKIPVEERNKRLDSCSKQIIYEFFVEGNSSRVDWVIASSDWNDPRPGDGESVGLRASTLEELDVFCRPVVRIAGDVSGRCICNFSWDFAECIPDRGASAILCGGSFNLVAVYVSIEQVRSYATPLTLLLQSPR